MVAIVFNELIKPKDIVWYATVGLLGMLYDKKILWLLLIPITIRIIGAIIKQK